MYLRLKRVCTGFCSNQENYKRWNRISKGSGDKYTEFCVCVFVCVCDGKREREKKKREKKREENK